jgi:biopolymer transport protein ExbD|tara:strand:+ start:567 stop:971 length:405 start_codon:yes stop_codon:yes gene_type:complete
MRFSHLKEEEDYSLQLTSLIDVVFLLLIFFMVSTTFVDFTRRLDIQLPEAKKSNEVFEKKTILIEIGLGKKIHMNGKLVELQSVESAIRLKVKEKIKLTTVTIKADKRIDYGFVVKILGKVFNLGIRDIAVAVK